MTICIIDDHQLLGQSLRYLFNNIATINKVLVYRSAEEFLAVDFQKNQPDIVYVDMVMPGLNAFEMFAQSKPQLPQTKFVILTSLIDADLVREAFRLGISGYITKDASEEELIESVSVVMQGDRYLNTTIKDKLVDHLFTGEQADYNLSPREKEVLQKICEGMTPKEIAFNMELSIHTIQQFIKGLMRKLKVKRTTDLVMLAINKGLYRRA